MEDFEPTVVHPPEISEACATFEIEFKGRLEGERRLDVDNSGSLAVVAWSKLAV